MEVSPVTIFRPNRRINRLGEQGTNRISFWRPRQRCVRGCQKLEAGTIHADAPRKVGGIIERVRYRINVRLLLKFGERQMTGEVSAVVEHLRRSAIQKYPPGVSRTSSGQVTGGGHLRKDVGGAIVAERVEPPGVIAQLVCLLQILEEQQARPFAAAGHVVEVNLLARSIVGAQANEIPLIGQHVNNLELPEEGANR